MTISLHVMQPLAHTNAIDLSLFETRELWKLLSETHRELGELKGICETLPNPRLLVQTLSLQEAKDSSEIENIITTHNDLYVSDGDDDLTVAAKEVQHYVEGLNAGFEEVTKTGLIRLPTILNVQQKIERNRAGLRTVPGTTLRNESTGETIYTPPQSAIEIEDLMNDLIHFIHDDTIDIDPLIRMVITHHQFESIHPFYDGNGRTGRILNILMLAKENLIHLPILYFSRYINHNKATYYQLLQQVRQEGCWGDWAVFMVKGIKETAQHERALIHEMRHLMADFKSQLRTKYKFYSQDLLNNLFRYPYTKTEFIMRDLEVSRPTATKYLETLVADGMLHRKKIGKTVFYVNHKLFELLSL